MVPEQDSLVDHLPPKPIMVLHLDNTIKMGHEPAHKTCALTKGTPIQVRLEDRTDTLQQELAKTTVVIECPPETGIRTRDAFMKRVNGHQSDIASTIASKDPHTTFWCKCASEHTTGQSGSHAWMLHLPMQLLPKLTQALQKIKQDEENAGNPGPYLLTETDYESLYILRQQYTENKQVSECLFFLCLFRHVLPGVLPQSSAETASLTPPSLPTTISPSEVNNSECPSEV